MPTLHISTGIHQKIFETLEQKCNNLDKQIFFHRVNAPTGPTSSTAQNNFDQAVAGIRKERQTTERKVQKKKRKVEELVEDVGQMYVAEVDEEEAAKIYELRQEVQRLVSTPFSRNKNLQHIFVHVQNVY